MKLSDFVANFIADIGVRAVFGVSGGACMHLMNSIDEHSLLELVCTHHEASAAMAADGYARSTNSFGCAVVTSGPGATNLVTGIAGSFYDSIPTIFITGQVSTFRQVKNSRVRQIGFQETPITEIVESITKYSVKITDPLTIKYELEKACFIAKSGRPGPVLVDIPDDLQRLDIDIRNLASFGFPDVDNNLSAAVDWGELYKKIKGAKRPLIIVGSGVRLSGALDDFLQLHKALSIPVVGTWGIINPLSNDDPMLFCGGFGTHGSRSANLAVRNADLILSIGCRLDTKATGTPVSSFAPSAFKIVVDIDHQELEKFSEFGLQIDLKINLDARHFINKFLENINQPIKASKKWSSEINKYKLIAEEFDNSHRHQTPGSPYKFFNYFSKHVEKKCAVFVDTGCSVAWLMQSSQFSSNTLVFHDCNNTAMGWALPASIGSQVSNKSLPHYCIVGDGAFMMSMQELATLSKLNFPIKIFIINNNGYSMIKQTQDQWFNGKYFASGSSHLSFPEFKCIAAAFGVQYKKIDLKCDFETAFDEVVSTRGPVLCEVCIDPDCRVVPQVKFGHPNEDMEPLLPRAVFNKLISLE